VSALLALREYLTETSGVTALLDNAEAVFVGEAPWQPGASAEVRPPAVQKPPYVVLHGLSDPGHYSLAGAVNIGNPLIQVEAWARRAVDAIALADALDTALSAYRGALSDSVYALGIFRRDRRGPTPTDEQDGGEQSLFSVQSDYEAWRR
jgi:hypothetical protein